MAYLMTHSLLSAWLYSMKENPYADTTQEDTSKEDFLRVLRREPTPTTEAMQNGIDFENLVTDIVNGKFEAEIMSVTQEPNSGELIEARKYPKWFGAAVQVADIVRGGQLQYVAKETVRVRDTDLLLYGRLDALKAGQIYDIKFSKGYDRGKYYDSTQHPMYLELIPEAKAFTYLVSNGTEVWTEQYRRDETPSIYPVIVDFLRWLEAARLLPVYQEHWTARSREGPSLTLRMRSPSLRSGSLTAGGWYERKTERPDHQSGREPERDHHDRRHGLPGGV